MSMLQTFELDRGRIFVSGLFWQPLPGTSNAQRKAEAEKIAEEQQFNLMVLRTTGVQQVGFASSKDGAKLGMLSIAAIITKMMEVEGKDRNLLVAAEIGNGRYIYVAQREGVILPTGDMVGTENEVRAKMLSDKSLGDWETIFAPSHWGIQGSHERALLDFFPKKKNSDAIAYKRWWSLIPVKKDWKSYLPQAALVALAVLGYVSYSEYQKHLLANEMAAIAAAAEAQAAQGGPVATLEHPWKVEPRATAVMAACDAALSHLSNFWPAGWTLNELVCAGGTLRVSWTRQQGAWVAHLLAVQPNATLASNGNSASLTVPLTIPAGEDEPVLVETERLPALFRATDRLGYTLNINAAAPKPVLPGDAPNMGPIKTWEEFGWSISGAGLPPRHVLAAMEGPGLRVSRIAQTLGEGELKWKMEGVQYVKK